MTRVEFPRPTRRTEARRRRVGWPTVGLDIEALRAEGWRPTPIREFVLKVQSRCNLACDHCYVYEMADQSWRGQPPRMALSTVVAAAERIREHAEAHGLPLVRVVLHGGEPMLLGAQRIAEVASTIRQIVQPIDVDLAIQTNGTLLDEAALDALLDNRIKVGVSVDGSAEAHDRHRRHPDGRGSHRTVAAALDRLRHPRYRSIYAGLLCTVDLLNDPIETYEHLAAFGPPMIDLLLPHGNWSGPPPGRSPGPGTPYGDWLVAVFTRWYEGGARRTGIRLFEDIMSTVLGGDSRSESIGLSPIGVAVIETDGTIQQVDALKSSYDGAAHTGLDVFADPLESVLSHPGVVARQIGRDALSSECRSCALVNSCGGGNYAHRFRLGDGYGNPSVYCPDLFKLVGHIRDRVIADIATLRRP